MAHPPHTATNLQPRDHPHQRRALHTSQIIMSQKLTIKTLKQEKFSIDVDPSSTVQYANPKLRVQKPSRRRVLDPRRPRGAVGWPEAHALVLMQQGIYGHDTATFAGVRKGFRERLGAGWREREKRHERERERQ